MSRTYDLEVALQEAIELAVEGWGYVDEYFLNKWSAPERIEALWEVHNGASVPRLKDGSVPPSWPMPAYKDELAKDFENAALDRLEDILEQAQQELPALRGEAKEVLAILRRMADKASSYGR